MSKKRTAAFLMRDCALAVSRFRPIPSGIGRWAIHTSRHFQLAQFRQFTSVSPVPIIIQPVLAQIPIPDRFPDGNRYSTFTF